MDNRLFDALRRIQDTLAALDHRRGEEPAWALVGGLAFSVRVQARTTHDIDLAVLTASDREAEQLIYALRGASYGIINEGQIEQTGQDRLATTRLTGPEAGIVVDLLFASSGIEPEIVKAAELIEMASGYEVPVAQLGHLLAMKLLSYRSRDVADIEAIVAYASAEDLVIAQESLRLIEARGYDRGADLMSRFRAHVPS